MKRLSIVLCLTLLLGGCGEYVEVNDKSFVIAMGIDEGKNDLLRVSLLFTTPEAGSGEEGGGEKPKAKDLVTVEAPTVYSAMRLIDTFKSKQLDIAHTKLIVFSREIAEKGIDKYVTDFVNTRGFRPSIYMAVAEDKAEEFFENIKPKQDIYIEKYIEHLFGKVTNDDVNDAYLYNNYFASLGDDGSNILPLVGVSGKEAEKEAESDFKTVIPDDLSANFTASEIPVNKEKIAVLCGYAVFGKGKMLGTLGLTESELVRMMTKNLPYDELSIFFPEKKRYITVNIHQNTNPKIRVKTGDIPEIEVKIELRGEYTGVEGVPISAEENERFSSYVSESVTGKLGELLARTQTEFGADILHLGRYAKKNFPTNDRWKEYNWEEKYKTARIVPLVNLEINDYGETK